MKTYKERTQSILEKAEVQRKKRKRIKLISILSGVAAALLAFNLVLFVPYTVNDADISKYKSSAYYGVIKQLYGLTYSPRKTNNFNEWFDGMFAAGAADPTDSGMSSSPATAEIYQETTLNQTDGVIEGDLFKRSDAHIFYLGFRFAHREVVSDNKTVYQDASYNLRIYSIAGEYSEQITEYKITSDDGMSFAGYTNEREMYLSEDLSTVTVITPCYDNKTEVVYTVIINVDVSDLSAVKETSRTYVSGRYVSSRVTDDNILLISDFTVRDNVDFDNMQLYVPHYGKRNKLKALLADDIVCPSDAASPRYTVISSLNSELEVIDSVALLSYSDDVYVSQNNLFATRGYDRTVKTDNTYDLTYSNNMSEIRIVPYGNGKFGDTQSVTAAGSVLNRYSLDEYNNTLRVVTTVRVIPLSYTYSDKDPYANTKMFGNRCMLYCYDLDTLEVTAKVTSFAPVGESVKSARFYGDIAYVCTAEVNYSMTTITDPVFAFDLSDLNNITYKDTGTIPGYSLSLTAFADNTLLGIGYGGNRFMLKIELYEQTETDVASVAKYEQDSVSFSSEFKAHLIDAKNGIIGLGVRSQKNSITHYVLFRYDGYDVKEIASVEMESSRTDDMRATVVDGYVYIFEESGFNTAHDVKVVKIA